MLLPDEELVVFDDEHCSLNTACISIDLNLSLFNITNNSVLLGQVVLSSHSSDVLDELGGVSMVSNPLAVQEDLVGLVVQVVHIWG